MDQKKIGSFLKELRKERGFTQEQIAEKLGVSGRTISRWETGSNMPDISLLVGIAELYEVTIPEIINGERKSENMREEVREVAEKMADYAGVEKEKIIKDTQKFSLMGVCAVVGVMILDMIGVGSNIIAGKVYGYFETLAFVSVLMIFFSSTGLLYRMNRKNKLNDLPKPIAIVIAGVLAFALAAVLKYGFSFLGL